MDIILSKRLTGLFAAIVVSIVGSPAFGQTAETYAGTVLLETGKAYASGNNLGDDPYQASDGGEFTALISNPTLPAGYSGLAELTVPIAGGGTQKGFETFCVEDDTYFWSGVTYDYSISNNIQVPSGGAVEGNNSTPYTLEGLDVGVALLYEQFATGTLPSYNYNSPDTIAGTAARLADAGLLQTAIWDLQGAEGAVSGDPALDNADPATAPTYAQLQADAVTNPYINEVVAAFGNKVLDSTAQYGYNFDVKVMDLYSGSQTNATSVYQDQLIYEGPLGGVPDGGATLAMLGLSLSGLAVGSRRLRKGSASV